MSNDTAASPRSFLRTWFVAIVLCLAGLALTGLWLWPEEGLPRMKRVSSTIGITLVTFLVVNFWLFFLSRPNWWRMLGALVLLAVGAWALVREVKFDGDLVPQGVVFRWDAKPAGSASATSAVPLAKIEAEDYPEYRGARRDGVAQGPALARDWQASPPRLLWRQPVGGGHSSFAIVGTAAVTLEQRGDNEAVVCYDIDEQKLRWAHEYEAHFQEWRGGPGPRATPTLADGDVYSLGATGWLLCLDGRNGQEKWRVNILADNDNVTWGMSGSPLVYDDVVVVNPGVQRASAANKALVAYDRKTGTLRWGAGSTKAGYSSPMLATLAGRRQILLFDGEGLGGYDAGNGGELWRHDWVTDYGINVAQPVVLDDERVFISSGYEVGCALLKVAEVDGKWSTRELWRNRNMKCKFTSPVAHQGYLYGLDDGILVCLDEKNGKRKWKGERYGHGQLLLTGDVLVILSEGGKLVLVEASPQEPRELGSIAALSGRTWNCPALARGKAFLRNDREMAWYELTGR